MAVPDPVTVTWSKLPVTVTAVPQGAGSIIAGLTRTDTGTAVTGKYLTLQKLSGSTWGTVTRHYVTAATVTWPVTTGVYRVLFAGDTTTETATSSEVTMS